MSGQQPKFVSLGTLAKCLSVAPSTIRNHMKDGRIPDYTYFKFGKNYRFDIDTILLILRDGKNAPQQVEVKQEVIEPVQKVVEQHLQTTPSPQLEFDFDADEDI